MPFYIVDKNNSIFPVDIIEDNLYTELLKLPEGKMRAYIYDKNPSDDIQKDLLNFSETLDNYVSVISHMLCSNLLEINLSKYDLQGIVFQRYGESVLIRALGGFEKNPKTDLIHIDIICGSGGASVLIDALKDMIKIGGIRLYPLPNLSTLNFYNKNGFRPFKEDVEYFINRIKKDPKFKDDYENDKEYFFLKHNIAPELYWYKNKNDSRNDELYVNNNWDEIIKNI